MNCDLHTHSTASDGTVTPAELAELATEAQLGALALTDHDTTEGLAQCAARCKTRGICFVPGIEISSDPSLSRDTSGEPGPQGTLHILGLFVQHGDTELASIQDRMRQARDQRNPEIVHRLQTLGIDITYRQVQDLAAAQGTRVIGRPHIGEVLMAGGHVASMAEAFQRYLGRHGAAYVRRDRLPATTAIDGIHHAGGLAILAHPIQLALPDPAQLEVFVRQLAERGLDGIETRHSDHNDQTMQTCETIAKRAGLLTSGGSDFHGSRTNVVLGGQGVPMTVYEQLFQAWHGSRSNLRQR